MVYRMSANQIEQPTTQQPVAQQTIGQFGYRPTIYENLRRIFSKGLIKILFLNGKNKFSNVFMQMLDPHYSIIWNGQSSKNKVIRFRTGHGRLLWRANTFYKEEPMMINWLKTFNQEDIFLDIGANVGTYTVPGAIESKLTYACELDPINIGLLKENLFLNGLTHKVIIMPFPATSKHMVADIFYRDFSRGDALQSIGNETPLNTIEGSGKHVSLQLGFPLDSIFEQFNLEYPSKIKIDVDGNEKTVFEGATQVIFNAAEVYYEDSGLKDSEDIINQFISHDYQIVSKERPKNSEVGCNLLFRKKTS